MHQVQKHPPLIYSLLRLDQKGLWIYGDGELCSQGGNPVPFAVGLFWVCSAGQTRVLASFTHTDAHPLGVSGGNCSWDKHKPTGNQWCLIITGPGLFRLSAGDPLVCHWPWYLGDTPWLMPFWCPRGATLTWGMVEAGWCPWWWGSGCPRKWGSWKQREPLEGNRFSATGILSLSSS